MFSPLPPLLIIELTAVVVSALYGILLAARKGMDVMGAFTAAFAVAFGMAPSPSRARSTTPMSARALSSR